MIDTLTLMLIGGTFLIAGGVKGVIGLGLPAIILGLLVTMLDLTTAMALTLIPSFATNIWQALVGGNGKAILQRIWPFLFLATLGIWFGSIALIAINAAFLLILLGFLLFAYAFLNLVGFSFSISPRHEKWTGVLFGTVNGIFTGMTGTFAVPGVMYLQAVGLSRDMLVQAMGILFTLSTVSLALVLQKNDFITTELVVISGIGVIPAIVGMMIGQGVRRRISEQRFRNIFFISILILGLFIGAKAIAGLYAGNG